MAKNVVTLYIDDTSIRLLVAHGNRIKKWADLPLEPGLDECAIPTTPEETRSVLTRYFRDPDTGLIVITEPLAKPIEATLMELSEAPVPVILLIPDRQGATGAYEDVLRELIRRAVGIDINV